MNINTQLLTWGTCLLLFTPHFKLANLTKSCIEYNRHSGWKTELKIVARLLHYQINPQIYFARVIPITIFFQYMNPSKTVYHVSAIWQALYLTPGFILCWDQTAWYFWPFQIGQSKCHTFSLWLARETSNYIHLTSTNHCSCPCMSLRKRKKRDCKQFYKMIIKEQVLGDVNLGENHFQKSDMLD